MPQDVIAILLQGFVRPFVLDGNLRLIMTLTPAAATWIAEEMTDGKLMAGRLADGSYVFGGMSQDRFKACIATPVASHRTVRPGIRT